MLQRRDMMLASLCLPLAALPARFSIARPPSPIRVASNQGAENATIQQLMADQRIAERFGIGIELVSSSDIAGPLHDLATGKADVCMVSAFAGVLPAIEKGAPVRIVGTAMRLAAIAIFSADPGLQSLDHLKGKTIGIGPKGGLLHLLALATLRKRGVAVGSVNLVSVGSNADVLRAVASGKVDAGLGGIAGFAPGSGLHTLRGGMLWHELPDFTYQLAYASLDALRQRPDAVARCLAAYACLFRFLQSGRSRQAYLDARRAVGADMAEGEQVWEFIHRHRPYAPIPGISARRLEYLQSLNRAAGIQARIMPFAAIADPSPANLARRYLSEQG